MKSIVIGASTAGLFQTMARRWRRQAARLADPYRPECHYMRGPGPKCREKHDLSWTSR